MAVAAKRLTALLAAVAVLAAPAAAFADGAGDQQYQDPLSAPPAPKQKKRSQPQQTAQQAPSSSVAPAASSAPAAAPAPTPATPAQAPAATDAELPRTGVPAGPLALAGALLVAAGLSLRRRIPAA
jgi:LPXTG-motif cell wall-anchored protein